MTGVWLESILAASVRGGAALLVAWLVSLLPRVPAAVRCWVWRAAYGALLISLVWRTPVELPLLRPLVVKLTTEKRVAVEPHSNTGVPTSVEQQEGTRRNDSVAIAPSAPKQNTEPHKYRPIAWHKLAFRLWLLFLAVYAGRLILGFWRTHRLRRGRLIHVRELADLCSSMAVKRLPEVRTHPAARGPLLLGFWHPLIILPEPVPCPGELRLMIAHELSHQRRGDLLWNWLPTLAMALLPFHPLVWICNRRWRLDTEAACDASAMAATHADPADYAKILIHVATVFRPHGSSVLTVAAAAESRWLLKQRLAAMAHTPHWNRKQMITGAVAAGILGVIAAVPWRVVAQQPPTTQPASMGGQPAIAPNSQDMTIDISRPHKNAGSPTTAPSYQLYIARSGKLISVSVPEGATVTLGSNPPTTQRIAASTTLVVPVAVSKYLSDSFSEHDGHLFAATAELTAGKSGTVSSVNGHEGDLVRAGDLLLKIDDTEERAKLDYQRDELKVLQIKLKTVRQLARQRDGGKAASGTPNIQTIEFSHLIEKQIGLVAEKIAADSAYNAFKKTVAQGGIPDSVQQMVDQDRDILECKKVIDKVIDLMDTAAREGGNSHGPNDPVMKQLSGQRDAMVARLRGVTAQKTDQFTKSVDSQLTTRRDTVSESLDQVNSRIAKLKQDIADTSAKPPQPGNSDVAATESEVQEAELAVELANAQIALAEAELGQTRIVAPCDGIMGACEIQPGERLNAGQHVTSVVQVGALKLSVTVNTALARQLMRGMILLIKAPGSPGIHAVISSIDPVVDPGSGTQTVKAQLIGDARGLLPGDDVTIALPATP